VEASGARGVSPAMEGFYQRRTRATGHFFTQDQIHSMQARMVTDILRRVPGANVRTVAGTQGGGQAVSMGRTTGASGNRACDAIYYVNGQLFPVSADVGINAFVRPHDIEAMEVYSGAARIPSEFNTGMRGTRCGVVVIWTRSGPAARARSN
jgi:outer membrane receptor for ferrienterochelin and colicin